MSILDNNFGSEFENDVENMRDNIKTLRSACHTMRVKMVEQYQEIISFNDCIAQQLQLIQNLYNDNQLDTDEMIVSINSIKDSMLLHNQWYEHHCNENIKFTQKLTTEKF